MTTEATIEETNDRFRQTCIEQLREGRCSVRFTKKDGTSRLMECTLDPNLIPASMVPSTDGNTQTEEKAVNTEIVKCFDLEKEAWRSFRVDLVVSFMNL